MEKNLDRLQRFLFNSTLFFMSTVIFIFSMKTSRTYDVTKAFWIKFPIGIIACLWAIYMAIHPKRWELLAKCKLFAVPLVIYTALIALSSIFSVDQWASITGTYYRQIGLQGYVIFTLVYFIMITCSKDKRDPVQIILWMVIPTFLTSIKGFMDMLGIDPLESMMFRHGRLMSFLGNANFSANVFALVLPFCFYFILRYHNKNKTKFTWSVLSMLVIGFGLILSQTRGSWLGYLAASILFVLALLIYVPSFASTSTKKMGLISCILGMAFFVLHSMLLVLYTKPWIVGLYIVAVIILSLIFLKLTKFLKISLASSPYKILVYTFISSLIFTLILWSLRPYIGFIGRYFSIFDWKKTIRWQLWVDSVALIFKYPWLGSGPDTYRFTFIKYKSQALEDLLNSAEYDNPHNNYLNIVTTMGIPCLIVFMWWMGKFFTAGKELLGLNKISRDQKILVLTFGAVISSYLIYSIFAFDNYVPISYLMLTTIAFTLLYNQFIAPPKRVHFAAKAITVVVCIGIFPGAFYTGKDIAIRTYADKIFLDGYFQWYRKKNLHLALKTLDHSIKLNPNEPFYYVEAAKAIYDYAKDVNPLTNRLVWVKKAEGYLEKALAHPWNIENIYLARIHGRLLVDDYKTALKDSQEALSIAPRISKVKKVLPHLIQQVKIREIKKTPTPWLD